MYDCTWQNPFDSAKIIATHLKGLHKPIYHPMCTFVFASKSIISLNSIHLFTHSIYDFILNCTAADCGDHVVVINTGKIAMPGDEWLKRVYFEHTGFAGGGLWTLAYELHEKDKTKVQ